MPHCVERACSSSRPRSCSATCSGGRNRTRTCCTRCSAWSEHSCGRRGTGGGGCTAQSAGLSRLSPPAWSERRACSAFPTLRFCQAAECARPLAALRGTAHAGGRASEEAARRQRWWWGMGPKGGRRVGDIILSHFGAAHAGDGGVKWKWVFSSKQESLDEPGECRMAPRSRQEQGH